MIKKMLTATALSLVIGACAMAQTQPEPAKIQTQPHSVTAPVQLQTTPPAGQTPANPSSIHERQERQQQRIGQGVENVKLTSTEAKRLEKREATIQKEKKEAKEDGKVTAKEKKEITKDQNKTSKAIYKQKHDDQKMKEAKEADKK